MTNHWQWDESLFRGSAAYYVQGRLPYSPALAEHLHAALNLDGSGRLLDVGCGPGVLTLPLAPHFADALGVDPDPDMLIEGEKRATNAGITNIRWLRSRAEELTEEIGTFSVTTFGQSFHWLDRPRVVRQMTDLLVPDGAFVHVAELPAPPPALPTNGAQPPFDEISRLIADYLGPVRRAGQSLYHGESPSGEAAILAEAGYRDFRRLVVPNSATMERSSDDIVAWVFSRSRSTPHLFGDERDTFERDLRLLLRATSPSDTFVEALPDTEVWIWRRPLD